MWSVLTANCCILLWITIFLPVSTLISSSSCLEFITSKYEYVALKCFLLNNQLGHMIWQQQQQHLFVWDNFYKFILGFFFVFFCYFILIKLFLAGDSKWKLVFLAKCDKWIFCLCVKFIKPLYFYQSSSGGNSFLFCKQTNKITHFIFVLNILHNPLFYIQEIILKSCIWNALISRP